MTAVIIIIAVLAAFFWGLMWGCASCEEQTPKIKTVQKQHGEEKDELYRIRLEYNNFLNYDGTVQSEKGKDE